MTNAVELRGIGRKYGRNWGLQDCTLSIPAGSIAALVGPNGAGKSTLLNLLIGLISPTTGTMSILGRDIAGSGVRQDVSYLAQDHPLYKSFTVAEMLRVGRVLNARWDQNLATGRLAELNIPLDRRVGKLSGGQRAQVALAIALATRPKLLLLDEPIAALDPLARKDFMGLVMEEVAVNNTTVVVSSHIVAELERFCDYLIVIRDGRLQLADHVDEVITTHHRLIGPTNTADLVSSAVTVLARDDSQMRTTLFAHSAQNISFPDWTSENPTLEDVVMKHLERPTRPSRKGTPLEVTT